MGRTSLEGGTMRPEGSLDVIWPGDRILIQNRRKTFSTASYPHLYEIICSNYYFIIALRGSCHGRCIKTEEKMLFGPLNKFSVTLILSACRRRCVAD